MLDKLDKITFSRRVRQQTVISFILCRRMYVSASYTCLLPVYHFPTSRKGRSFTNNPCHKQSLSAICLPLSVRCDICPSGLPM